MSLTESQKFEKGEKRLRNKLARAIQQMGLSWAAWSSLVDIGDKVYGHRNRTAMWIYCTRSKKEHIVVSRRLLRELPTRLLTLVLKHEFLHKAMYRNVRNVTNKKLINYVLDAAINKILFLSKPRQMVELCHYLFNGNRLGIECVMNCSLTSEERAKLPKSLREIYDELYLVKRVKREYDSDLYKWIEQTIEVTACEVLNRKNPGMNTNVPDPLTLYNRLSIILNKKQKEEIEKEYDWIDGIETPKPEKKEENNESQKPEDSDDSESGNDGKDEKKGNEDSKTDNEDPTDESTGSDESDSDESDDSNTDDEGTGKESSDDEDSEDSNSRTKGNSDSEGNEDDSDTGSNGSDDSDDEESEEEDEEGGDEAEEDESEEDESGNESDEESEDEEDELDTNDESDEEDEEELDENDELDEEEGDEEEGDIDLPEDKESDEVDDTPDDISIDEEEVEEGEDPGDGSGPEDPLDTALPRGGEDAKRANDKGSTKGEASAISSILNAKGGYSTFCDLRSYFQKYIYNRDDAETEGLIDFVKRFNTEKQIESMTETVYNNIRSLPSIDPFPIALSRTGFELVALDVCGPEQIPLYFNNARGSGKKKVCCYFDTSPSMHEYIPYMLSIVDFFNSCEECEIAGGLFEGKYAFSEKVAGMNPEEWEKFCKGEVRGGCGTSFETVVQHAIHQIDENEVDIVMVFTDGFSGVNENTIAQFNATGKTCYRIYFTGSSLPYWHTRGRYGAPAITAKTNLTSDLDKLNGESFTIYCGELAS